ncbi:hypothetical protein LUZ60_006038 [Juncus effusus]|nr:hypothetical protein LUZ60_006038 [Juncus effusus]
MDDFAVKMEDVRETEERESASKERSKVSISLKQEIQQLEKKLHDQFTVRRALEKALGQKSYNFTSSPNDYNNINNLPNPTKELIKEITLLELQVIHLEQHLLSLYRNTFTTHSISSQTEPLQFNQSNLSNLSYTGPVQFNQSNLSNLSYTGPVQSNQQNLSSRSNTGPDQSNQSNLSSQSNTGSVKSNQQSLARMSDAEALTDHVQSNPQSLPRRSDTGVSSLSVRPQERPHGIGRSHSSLLNRSARVSPAEKNLSRVLKPCFTSPLTFVEEKQDIIISLAEHLGTKVSDHITLTPNKISEELIRCMCTIYYKSKTFHNNSGAKTHFSAPFHSFSYSPCSSFSSSRDFVGDFWSPKSKRESNCRESENNCRDLFPGNSIPYNSLFEVSDVSMDGCVSNAEIEALLRNYKLLIQRLETVDLIGLKNEEKLAFWINIHNSIIMHAHIEKGTARNNKRRLESLNKVTYLIKGQKVNMEMIQSRILGCSKTPSNQWLKLLLYGKVKSKTGEDSQCSPVDQPEPLLHFALCSGSHSDPALRIYNPKRLYNQLETAKEEYIISKIQIQKENKILLPRLIESYVKDAGLNIQETLEMVERYLPQSLRAVLQNCKQEKFRKVLEWAPHDFTFRYVISREAANFQTF